MITVFWHTNIDCCKRFVAKLPNGLEARPMEGDLVTLNHKASFSLKVVKVWWEPVSPVSNELRMNVYLDMIDHWKGDLRSFEKHIKGA